MLSLLVTAGLTLNVVGVLVLFRFGMPFRLRGKPPSLALRFQSDEDRSTDRRYDTWGYVGIIFIVIGTVAQLVAVWTHPPPELPTTVALPTTNEALRVAESARAAAWFQGLVTALVGVGAICAAIVQIRRFAYAERARATIQYVAKFEEAVHQVPNNPNISVSTALSLASGIARSEPDLRRYKASATSGKRNMLPSADQTGYDRYSTSFAISGNYFIAAAEYIKQGLLDGKMFVNFFGKQILLLKEAIEAVQDVEPTLAQFLNASSFKDLVRAAQEA